MIENQRKCNFIHTNIYRKMRRGWPFSMTETPSCEEMSSLSVLWEKKKNENMGNNFCNYSCFCWLYIHSFIVMSKILQNNDYPISLYSRFSAKVKYRHFNSLLNGIREMWVLFSFIIKKAIFIKSPHTHRENEREKERERDSPFQ